MRRSGTILIADDDQNDVLLISHALESAGIHNPIQWFRDGASLIDFLKRDGAHSHANTPIPMLVFLDWRMPHTNTAEVIKWIRRQPEYLNLLTVVLTGSDDPNEKQAAYEAGANWHLVKSADFSRLTDLVRRIREFWSYAVERCEKVDG